jgi:hypothetical protein
MHMSVSKRAASARRLPATVLAAALGLLLAAANTATAIEPARTEAAAAAEPAPQDVLPPRSDQREPGAEARPTQTTTQETSASGPVVSAQALAALLSDPAIRTFVGIAENAWDFTRPETIPGFARLP